jgi:threonine 3-dehydrogenase
MSETMWAIRKLGPEPGLDRVDTPVPRVGDDDVLVRVEAASLCGTDLHIFHWDEWAAHRIKPPVTLGHEFAGTVVDVGRNVRHVGTGDYVSAESHITCGMCFHCRTGQAHMCEQTQILGVDRDGAFAEYVAVPESVIWRNDRSKLPPEIATLQEPFGNAVFATSTHDLAGKASTWTLCSRCPAHPMRSATRLGSFGTAATSSSSAFHPTRSRSTSPSR